MTIEDRWKYLTELDEELLKGGVILSEWCSFIIRESDIAFVNKAYLASILTAVSGVETYLRAEYAESKSDTLFRLIDNSPIDSDLKKELRRLRKYRNKWVHVDEPWNDKEILEFPDNYNQELKEMAYFAVKTLRKTIYENPWV